MAYLDFLWFAYDVLFRLYTIYGICRHNFGKGANIFNPAVLGYTEGVNYFFGKLCYGQLLLM